jgi:Domain of unknown function (DUF4372)/Transposase DDE domain
MSFQETVFSQLVQTIDHNEFRRCVKRYTGDYRSRTFSCWDLFLSLLFTQWAEKRSIRAVVFSLSHMSSKLYHMGFRGRITSSAISDAINSRDWRIFQDFAMSLIPKALELYKDDPIDPDIENTVYAFDSTTIDLCLSVFEWADFRKTKAGIKLHTLLNLRGSIPVQIDITNAKPHDVSGMDRIEPEKGAIYLWDKAYLDFCRLYRFEQAGAFFVMRSKNNTRTKRRYSKPANKDTGIQCDQVVVLGTKKVLKTIQSRFAA